MICNSFGIDDIQGFALITLQNHSIIYYTNFNLSNSIFAHLFFVFTSVYTIFGRSFAKKTVTLIPKLRPFFIQAAGLAYHHRTKCGAYHQGRLTDLASHHAPACIYLRLDDIQHFVLMIYRNELRMIYTPSA